MNIIIMDSSNNYINYVVVNGIESAVQSFPDMVFIDTETEEGLTFMHQLIANNYNNIIS